jgi:hypothetical protein
MQISKPKAKYKNVIIKIKISADGHKSRTEGTKRKTLVNWKTEQ